MKRYKISAREAWDVRCSNMDGGESTHFVTIHGGWRVYVTHATSKGLVMGIDFDQDPDWYFSKGRYLVACCYPLAVRERHPELHVIGDWDGITYVYDEWVDYQAHLVVSPARPVPQSS